MQAIGTVLQESGSVKLTQQHGTNLQAAPSELFWICQHCQNEVRPFEWQGVWYKTPHCKCNKSYAAKAKASITPEQRNDLIRMAGITTKMIDECKLGLFNPHAPNIANGVKVLETVEKFCEVAPTNKTDLLMLNGVYGVGKSMLAFGAAMRLMYRKALTGYYADFLHIGLSLQSDGSSIGQYADLMEKCGVLVIDDVDKESPGRNGAKLLLDVLSYRINRYEKITIITSNRGSKELISYLMSMADEGVSDKAAAIQRRINDNIMFNIPVVGTKYIKVKNG